MRSFQVRVTCTIATYCACYCKSNIAPTIDITLSLCVFLCTVIHPVLEVQGKVSLSFIPKSLCRLVAPQPFQEECGESAKGKVTKAGQRLTSGVKKLKGDKISLSR